MPNENKLLNSFNKNIENLNTGFYFGLSDSMGLKRDVGHIQSGLHFIEKTMQEMVSPLANTSLELMYFNSPPSIKFLIKQDDINGGFKKVRYSFHSRFSKQEQYPSDLVGMIGKDNIDVLHEMLSLMTNKKSTADYGIIDYTIVNAKKLLVGIYNRDGVVKSDFKHLNGATENFQKVLKERLLSDGFKSSVSNTESAVDILNRYTVQRNAIKV